MYLWEVQATTAPPEENSTLETLECSPYDDLETPKGLTDSGSVRRLRIGRNRHVKGPLLDNRPTLKIHGIQT